MEDLKEIIAKNLVKFRKSAKLTQLELAEKLKYSDKNISKWERGDSIPDVVVLKQLADLYKIKVDDFFIENAELVKSEENSSVKTKVMNKKQTLILLLSISLVWLAAIVLFSVFINVQIFSSRAWLCFIYAVTISCVVAVVFTSIWCTNFLNAIAVSLLIWSAGLSIFLTFNSPEIWAIFIVCIPLQILDILWFSLRKVNKNIKFYKNNPEAKILELEKKKIKNESKKLKREKLKQEKEQEKNNK